MYRAKTLTELRRPVFLIQRRGRIGIEFHAHQLRMLLKWINGPLCPAKFGHDTSPADDAHQLSAFLNFTQKFPNHVWCFIALNRDEISRTRHLHSVAWGALITQAFYTQLNFTDSSQTLTR